MNIFTIAENPLHHHWGVNNIRMKFEFLVVAVTKGFKLLTTFDRSYDKLISKLIWLTVKTIKDYDQYFNI